MAIDVPSPKFDNFSLEIEEVDPRGLIRISKHNTGEPYFGKSGANRFDDPMRMYGTGYFGFSLECAFAETILHDEIATPQGYVLPPEKLDRYVLGFTGTMLRVAVLCGQHLKNLGGNAAISSVTPYDIPQRWSRAIHEHPACVDGFVYMSNHLNDQRALALFDRAETKLRMETALRFVAHPGAPTVLEIFPIVPFSLSSQ